MQQDEPLTRQLRIWQGVRASDFGLLVLLALAVILLHTLVNGQYGFHRDELQTFDNARHLAWGYVVYPPHDAVHRPRGTGAFRELASRFPVFPALWRKASCCSSRVSQPANSAASATRNLWLPWR